MKALSFIVHTFCFLASVTELVAIKCPRVAAYAYKPNDNCSPPSDPNNLPKTNLEKWFTKEMFQDLFPKANLGRGPHPCLPYSYEAFIIAARYFPEFGAESPKNGYTVLQNTRRDVAAFFAHIIQETGENDPDLYKMNYTVQEASDCFYRGGLYNWFEGGRKSQLLPSKKLIQEPQFGEQCYEDGKYCAQNPELNFWYPCNKNSQLTGNKTRYEGCYFGRGPLQLSWNYNYGQFEHFLRLKKLHFNLLENPNLLMTVNSPPLAMIASLWFYMTAQPPKPSMHDIILGE
uniref:Glyco_hydro_19_cat domain-containing protein n=1 Tax=Syphacia muris TaxID=451379 RepID=A0A0N5ABC8_9BILA